MRWKRAVALLRVALAIALVGLAGAEDGARAMPGSAGEAVVEMVGLRYYPPSLEVASGTGVTWHNREPFDYPGIGGGHELLSEYYGAFESPRIAPGARWTHRFDRPGTYRYRCKRHLGSTGEIVVVGEPGS